MAAQKKLMTKGQIVAHFAGEFEISKKAAASIIDEYAAPLLSCPVDAWELRRADT
jgi:hypothetical protein